MKYTVRDIPKAFARGERAHAGNLSTDGRSLWSYNLKIAHKTQEGIVVGDFTTKGGDYYSTTTSKHVCYAKRVADTIMLPELFTELFTDKPF
jgi:hypothetical protein